MGVYIKGITVEELKQTCLLNVKILDRLVEVPIPHGRLIDADKIYSVIERHRNVYKGATNRNDMARRDEDLQVMADIVNAPTVIEAEGE